MLIIQNTLVCDELITEPFCCDYNFCKGMCCVEGDAGAPLEENEIYYIQNHLEKIIPFLNQQGIQEIQNKGVFVFDTEGKKVTPLIYGKECVFLIYINNQAYCSIEIAFDKGIIPFRKPISCHLYPIRITEYDDFIAVNYHKWHICKPAIVNGKEKHIFLYQFLKEALIRKFGVKWYDELCKAVEYVRSQNFSDNQG